MSNLEKNNQPLKARLARIKGQLNGLEQMLESQRDCLEVFNQLAAIKAALNGLGLLIVENETSCLQINKKDQEKFNKIVTRFLKVK
jgi:DNA-binding FrmR family transcriptional regulator